MSEKRDGRERRRSALLLRWLFALALLAGAGAVAFMSPIFEVKTVNVYGAGNVSEREARDAAGLAGVVNIFAYNAGKGAKALEALPYVREAVITKAYPGTIDVTIRERRPCGYIDLKGMATYILIDDEGVAMDAHSNMRRTLPVITGLAADGFTLGKAVTSDRPEACRIVFELARLLDGYDMAGLVTGIDVADERDVHVFAGAVDAAFGDGADANRKLQDLKSILDSGEIAQGARVAIDMRKAAAQYVFRYVK